MYMHYNIEKPETLSETIFLRTRGSGSRPYSADDNCQPVTQVCSSVCRRALTMTSIKGQTSGSSTKQNVLHIIYVIMFSVCHVPDVAVFLLLYAQVSQRCTPLRSTGVLGLYIIPNVTHASNFLKRQYSHVGWVLTC